MKGRKYEYLIIKIGDKIYSTDHQGPDKDMITHPRSRFARVTQEGEYITGLIKETNGHEVIEPIPFQVDLYFAKD
jgi:hypothetical protein